MPDHDPLYPEATREIAEQRTRLAPGPAVLLMGVTVAATVAVHVLADRPPSGRPVPAPDPGT